MRNLIEFLTKYYHWLLFILLEVASAMLLVQYNSYQSSAWVSSANAVVGQVNQWQADVEQYFSLTRVNEELTQRNVSLERQVTQLRQLYANLTQDTTDLQRRELQFLSRFQLIPAKVVANSIDRRNNVITLDRGRADGVEPDMGVACGNGVVGVVYMASDHFSVVLPVLNIYSRISCAIRGTGYFGYLRWDGKDPTIAYVEDIPRHARFKKGEWVETSGFSSIFPRGVLVGQILQTYNSSDGLSYRLKVALTTDFACLRDVCVISDKTFAERMFLEKAMADSLKRMQTP